MQKSLTPTQTGSEFKAAASSTSYGFVTKDETPEVIKNFLKKIYVRLQALVIIVRTDNETEFKNHVLKEYFDSVGITHETSAAKTPQRNRVVERRNRTLVAAARTMLIFSHAPLFPWAEAIATACYTQNRSIIHRHFNKTLYELIQGRKPNISYLHVFRALCYPKNDREDIGKLGVKGDIGFFIRYSPNYVAYRVSRPGLQSTTSGQIIFELELTYAPSIITPQGPSERDLDILFEPLNNEYLGGRPAEAPRAIPAAPVGELFVNPFGTPSTESVVSFTQYVDPSNMHTFYQLYPHDYQWTKDHPLKQVIGELSRPFLTKNQLKTDGDMCIYALTVSILKPKTIKEALTDPTWIESRQEELHQFIRLDVWELVSSPDGIKPLTLKWLFKIKHDEENTNGFSKGTIDLTLFNRRFDDDILVVNQSPSGIFINQSKYVHEILKKYGLNTSEIVGTPIDIKDKLDLDKIGTSVDATKYRSMIGALMYLTSSRPDIVHATCDSGFELNGFSDADYAGCKDTFKSTSSGAQFLGEKLVSQNRRDLPKDTPIDRLEVLSDDGNPSRPNIKQALCRYMMRETVSLQATSEKESKIKILDYTHAEGTTKNSQDNKYCLKKGRNLSPKRHLETKVTPSRPTDGFKQSHSVSSNTVPDPQDRETNIQLAGMGLPSTLDEGTRKSQLFPEGTVTNPADRDLTFIDSDKGAAKITSFLEGPRGDKDSEGLKPPADIKPQTNPIVDPSGTNAKVGSVSGGLDEDSNIATLGLSLVIGVTIVISKDLVGSSLALFDSGISRVGSVSGGLDEDSNIATSGLSLVIGVTIVISKDLVGSSSALFDSDEVGNEVEVPSVTAQKILARTKERKAKSTLLMAILDEYLARFHGIKDAKTLWAAIKTIFGEGLDKGYDRFQRLLSLLEIHRAGVFTKDANQKFLRSLPSAWSNISLIIRNKPGINNLDIDDLYNNLKVYEADINGSFKSSSNSQNVAFVYAESTSSTNELNVAYSVSTATGHSSQAQARNTGNKSRDDGNAGYIGRDNGKRFAKEDDEKALVVQDRLGTYDWSYQVEDEATEFALMAFTSNPSSSSSSNSELDEALKDKEYLKAKLKKFETSLKNLTKLLDSQIRAKVKTGLGYDSQFNEKEVLDAKEKKVTETVFDNRSSDEENSLANDRFKKDEGYHAVPPPLTRNYMPPKSDLSFVGLDDLICVKENQEKDKIGSKLDKNGKRGEAGKSLKQL
nr:retrovirus-related Pol polyprotein from transposon TNT 1-94 [Tanacetum cinerariifolium]